MDVLFDPYIHENFIKLKSFPFPHQGFLGHETAILNVFTFWNHYRSKYTKELSQIQALKEDISEFRVK